MESASEPGRIHVSDATYQLLLPHEPRWLPTGGIPVKVGRWQRTEGLVCMGVAGPVAAREDKGGIHGSTGYMRSLQTTNVQTLETLKVSDRSALPHFS